MTDKRRPFDEELEPPVDERGAGDADDDGMAGERAADPAASLPGDSAAVDAAARVAE